MLDDAQTATRRVPSASSHSMRDVGVNTSLCGSLQDGPLDADFAVNQRLQPSEEELSQFSNVRVHGGSVGGSRGGSRPGSALSVSQMAAGGGAISNNNNSVRCPSCGRSGSVAQVELYGADGARIGSAGVRCGACDGTGAEVRCSSCGRAAAVASGRVSAAPDEESGVEYLYRSGRVGSGLETSGDEASGLAGRGDL